MESYRTLRSPPRIKILEAAGAIGDGRVALESGPPVIRAYVTGSDGTRTYRVVASLEQGGRRVRAYSNDNGTRLRGYVGYPIIAVLMLAGLVPRSPKVEEALRGIPWRRLNEKYKKYSTVMEVVLEEAERRGVPRRDVLDYLNRAYRSLSRIRVEYDPSLAGLEAYL